MASLDNILDGDDSEQQQAQGESQQVVEQQDNQQQSELQTEAQENQEAQAAPTAEEQNVKEKHVPLAALEAERTQRKDWKEKALRLEGELKAFQTQFESQRQSQQQQYQQAEQVQVDPMLNMKCDMSEIMLRQQIGNDEEIDATIAKFEQMAAKDPALLAAMQRDRHPWKYAFDAVKRSEAMNEIGTDPAAYRANLEKELRAQWEAEQAQSQQSQSAAKPNLPQSLAGERSAAGRSASSWTGPTPLDNII